MYQPLTWHLILNAERRILGVYGGALLDTARDKRSELLALFPSLVISLVTRELMHLPRIGDIA